MRYPNFKGESRPQRSEDPVSNKLFIPISPELNYGGCSSVAERPTVARETGVRFSPSALFDSPFKEKCDILRNLLFSVM